MSHANIDKRFDLLARRLPEEYVIGHDIIYTALSNDKKRPRIIWETAPTGRPHIGYLIPLLKFVEFLRADCEVVVVLLDAYSFVDNVKYSWEQVQQRTLVYRYTVEAALVAIGVDPKYVTFVVESHHETNEKWIKDMWKLCTLVKQQTVKDAWDRNYNPDMLAPLLAPVHQALSEEYLDADIQFGGEDQIRLFAFGDHFMPLMGYKKRGHLMNKMLPNLMGGKMSSSHPGDTKIMFCEEPSVIEAKITKSFNLAEDKYNSGVVLVLKNILIPFSQLLEERSLDAAHCSSRGVGNPHLTAPLWTEGTPPGTVFTLTHDGQTVHYRSFEEIVSALQSGSLTFETLIPTIISCIIQIFEPCRKIWAGSKAWQTCDRLSYPEDYQPKEAAPAPVVVTTEAPAPIPTKQAVLTNGHTTTAAPVPVATNGASNGAVPAVIAV